MKRAPAIAICLGVFMPMAGVHDAFAWGSVHGAYGGAAYRGPMGGAAVRGPGGNWAARGPAGGTAYGHQGGATQVVITARITAAITRDITAARFIILPITAAPSLPAL